MVTSREYTPATLSIDVTPLVDCGAVGQQVVHASDHVHRRGYARRKDAQLYVD